MASSKPPSLDLVIINFSPSNQKISTGAGNDLIKTGSGNDEISSDGGNDQIYSAAGNDLVYAGSGNDLVYAGDGNDIVYAGSDHDIVYGGKGADKLYGETGNDTLYGEAGNDSIDGGAGSDFVYLGGDNDIGVYRVGENQGYIDYYEGGSGTDVLEIIITDMELSRYNLTAADLQGRFVIGGTSDFMSLANGALDFIAKGFETLKITKTNVAQNDFVVTNEDTPAAFNVLANDSDPSGNTLSLLSYEPLLHLSYNGGGSFSYDPTSFQYLNVGETFQTSFGYTIGNGLGGTSTAVVAITVAGVNDAPIVSSAITALASEDAAIFSVNLLQYASDVDLNDTLSVANLSYQGNAAGVQTS